MLGEQLQFVAGLDRQPVVQLAAANALRTCLHGADRHHHAPRQQRAGAARDQQAQHQQGQRAQAGVDDRLLGLRGRHLDEHQPAECRNVGMCRQDRHAGAVGGIRRLAVVARHLQRGFDLGQLFHVGAAQHQRDVAMGDQPAQAIDDVSVAFLADLDLRDGVEDEFQINIGHGDAAATAMRHCHGEVRLALLAEIDRAEIDLVLHGLDEGRVRGTVEVAGDRIQADPRHLELLAAGTVELGQLGDGRDQELHAVIFEVALFGW